MNSMARAFSYLIAAQVQAVALCMLAWWVGNWANENHPIGVSWYAITFPVAVIAIAQTFYVVIRSAIAQSKKQQTK
jgi:tellurite resistance protein TehA-like permease